MKTPILLSTILLTIALLGACRDGRTPVAALSAPGGTRLANVPARLTGGGRGPAPASTLILGLN